MVGIIDNIEDKEGNFHEIKVRLSTDYRKLYHVNLVSFAYKTELEELENRTKND